MLPFLRGSPEKWQGEVETMLVGFEGTLGAGKTLGMTIFAWYYALRCRTNLWSNVPYRREAFARHIASNPNFQLGLLRSEKDFIELAKAGGGIVAWDELHQSLDNRTWARRGQVLFTQFLMYMRKIRSPVFFTAQSIRNQVDVRIRNILDFAVLCSKNDRAFCYEWFDAVSGRLLRRILLPKSFATRFFAVYDTRQIVRPIHFPQTEREYVKFLDELERACIRTQAEEPPLDAFFDRVDPGEVDSSDDDSARVHVFLPVSEQGKASEIRSPLRAFSNHPGIVASR